MGSFYLDAGQVHVITSSIRTKEKGLFVRVCRIGHTSLRSGWDWDEKIQSCIHLKDGLPAK